MRSLDGRVPLLAALVGSVALSAPAADAPAHRFEEAVRRFEEKDKADPPPRGAILFMGSSTIVGWDTRKHFPARVTINRGFGGSTIADSLHFADRITIPYAPKTIVFYAGDNDIAKKATPAQVLADYQAYVKKVHAALPETRIYYIAIKPSIRRWELWPAMREANALIETYCKTDKRLGYIDIVPVTLGADGTPDPAIFKQDGLHLNEDGYTRWSGVVEKALARP